MQSFGDDTNRQSNRRNFFLLAGGALVFSTGFSVLQEQLYRIDGFRYGGWLTFLTYLTLSLIGLAEWALVERCYRQGKLLDFAVIALLATAGYYLTNWSLIYLDYATRICFKSCKILPVMLLGTFIQNKHYSAAEYSSGTLLVIGIALFTLGNKDVSANFHWAGVVLISIALCCEALTSNLEERRFFRGTSPCMQGEVVCLLSSFAASYAFIIVSTTGELGKALEHSILHQEVVPLACMAAMMGYAALSCVLMLIRHYGAVAAEVVKSMRKVLQVLASLLIYPRPYSWKYLVGTLCMVAALFGFQILRQCSQGFMQQQVWMGFPALPPARTYRPVGAGRGSVDLEDIPEVEEEGSGFSIT